MSEGDPDTQDLYSVGQIAAETGISPDTLRVWERRYGAPVPVRLPSGHRRYTGEQLHWLRRVATAISLGHRPHRVVPGDPAELDALLGTGAEAPEVDRRVAGWLELLRETRLDDLRRRVREDGDGLAPLALLEELVAPFLRTVGEAWARGELEVRQEHFASEVLSDYLRARRAELRAKDYLRARRAELRAKDDDALPTFVLATLPDEGHGLGLQMTALLCEEQGVRAHVLGTDTPLDEIVRAATDTGAAAVAVSISLSSAGVRTNRLLADLRAALPADVRLVVGGEGTRRVRRKRRDLDWFDGLAEFRAWLGKLER